MDLGLAGKVALVTGAGRGIGKGCALALAAITKPQIDDHGPLPKSKLKSGVLLESNGEVALPH